MNLAKRILDGDIRAASKLMREIDDGVPEAFEILKELYPHTGKAYIIGITGPPGSGKSTIVDRMIDLFRKEGKTIGIIAVDPTSPFSGGAILGDRIRMQRHATDDGVFIRSLATRGSLGGISRSTQEIINVMDAMGKEVIIVETVGVGQDEVDIFHIAHTSVVVLVPGLGDDIQAIKAGLIEIGDIFVINKCDREGADRLERDIRLVLEMGKKKDDLWEPLIFRTEAIYGKGIFDLVYGIYRHKQALERSGAMERKNRQRVKISFLEILKSELMDRFIQKMERDGVLETFIDDIMMRKTDPYSLVEKIINEGIFINSKKVHNEIH